MNSKNIKDLRVAWISDIFDELSGIVTDTREMNAIAKRRGVQWHPITCYPKPIEPFYCFKHVMRIPSGRMYKGTSLYVPDFMEFVIYLRKIKANIIISNTPSTMGLTAMAAAKYLGIPWVDIYHTDVDFYLKVLSGRITRFFIKPALWYVKQYHKQADLIFVRTKEYYDLMIKKGHKPSKLRDYPAGINGVFFSPKFKNKKIWKQYNIDSKKIIALFIGRITKVKDITYLLDVAKENKLDNLEIAIVGHGPEADEYRKKYASIQNIHFLGAKTGRELQSIYASSDIYVLPSASETLGKTVLEAMSSSVPVLVSSKGGPKDYVHENETGRIFIASNYQSFKEVFLSMIADKRKLKRMGKAARKSTEFHTDEKLFDKFTSHLIELI